MFCSIILSSVLHVSIENEAVSFIAGTVVAAISIVGCLIVGRIMERICPVLIGKSTNMCKNIRDYNGIAISDQIRKRFSPETIAKQLMAVYEEIV